MAKKKSYKKLQEDIREIKLPELEVWENKYRDRDYQVAIDTPEFTCLCPKTGLPDFASIRIEYEPDRFCLELKSYKEYLMAFRDVGIFHEHVINRIFDDFIEACRPHRARITGEFNVRGGIKTTVAREYESQGQ